MLSVQKSNRGVSRFDQSHKLRAVSPEELDSWSDGDSDTTLTEPEFYDLDESSDYMFRPGEDVWVKTAGGNWHRGKVSGQTIRKGSTRDGDGFFFPVVFNEKIRKYFAPKNGEIKADTHNVRSLLKDAGWLPLR